MMSPDFRLLELLAQSASRLLNSIWHHLDEKERRVGRRERLREVGREMWLMNA